jgi:hypothetical protein
VPDFLASTAARLIAGLAVLLLIVAFVLWLKWDDAAQPKQDARSANAAAETAKETAATVIDRAEADATVDELVRETAKEIDAAATPQEAAAKARRAICSFAEYKDTPQCVN